MSIRYAPIEDRPGFDWDARNTNMLPAAELRDVLARYKADDDSWPRGILHLRRAIATAEARK